MQVTSIRLRVVTLSGTTNLIDFAVSSLSQSQSYILKDANGLDAAEIIAQYYGSSMGGPLYKMVSNERKIDLLIKLNPQYHLNETPSSLRDALYRAISYTRQGEVQLAFMDGSTVLGILSCFINKVENVIFSNSPSVKLGLSAKFPLIQNPLYTEHSFPVAGTTIEWTDNLSTAPSGFRFTGTFNANASELVFIDGNSPMVYVPGGGGGGYTGPKLTINYSFLNNDALYYGSEDQGKYLYIIRSSTVINLVDKVLAGSFWLQSMPGYNKLALDDSSKVKDVVIRYRPTYWGL